MTEYFDIRSNLKATLEHHVEVLNTTEYDPKSIHEILEQLNQGELSIAVVGEVNRGKSTFLNALLGAKIFPSRASVCTAGVTILDNADEPRAEITFKNGKTKKIEISVDNPSQAISEVISRKNQDVQKINAVRIWYPNTFTGKGIILVDTPGVNDPESWREEITYEYLAAADAVIMILDPMQPLSASEVEFLEHKILGRSIANLIFVVNKIDDVSLDDRQVAINRIENVLQKYVPNPTIFPLASKPALLAKLAGEHDKLNSTGLLEFEDGLHAFLTKGRGGLLLKSKILKGVEHLQSTQNSISSRMSALDSEKRSIQEKLKQVERKLKTHVENKDELSTQVNNKAKKIKEHLRDAVRERERYLDNSLKVALQGEPSVSVLRGNILTFQRDCVESLQNASEYVYMSILDELGVKSQSIKNNVADMLKSLHSEASTSVNSIQVSTEKVKTNYSQAARKQGATMGGIAGAGAGIAIASTATTVGVTTAGTIGTVAAFSTMGAIGIGILTGGVGLLIGAAVAGMLADDSSSAGARTSSYVEYDEMVNNRRAILAVERFLSKLGNNVNLLTNKLEKALHSELIEPISRQIAEHNKLVTQINSDLGQTTEEQKSIREQLSSKAAELESLNESYLAINTQIEAL